MFTEKKKQLTKENIKNSFGGNIHDPRCSKMLQMVDRMADANIPAGYWLLKMKDFHGSPKLAEITNDYIENIKDKFALGESICLTGNQGTGKTMSSICMLKAALKNGFDVYYTTASDIMADMTNFTNNREIRSILRNTDFLVIDELDSRFFTSDAQKELFSGIYENIFRHRAHNMLPTIICTNETDNILNVFYGAATQSIQSLNTQYLKIYPVVGLDFRKRL